MADHGADIDVDGDEDQPSRWVLLENASYRSAADVVAALKKGNGNVELTSLNGQKLTVLQKDGKIWIKDAKDNYSEITATDVMGTNGVVHVINSVVMPK